MNYALNSGSLSLNLSPKEQTELMAGIEAIFQSDGELPSEDQEMADDDDDDEPKVDLEDQQKRTEKLKGVLPTLAQLWWCHSEHIDLAAEKLADGSRNRESMTFSAIIFSCIDSVTSICRQCRRLCLSVAPLGISLALRTHAECLVSKMESTTGRFWHS
jgi:hypothetical protein